MAAVRVPPSACRTSQSIAMLFSPRAPRSIAARSERPISRLISCVRPPMRPLTDSRSERVCVARGSIAYSLVTQPRPEPLRQRGTPSVTLAAQSTRVPPNSTSTEPSAWSSQPRVIVTGRSSSALRPSGLVTATTLPAAVRDHAEPALGGAQVDREERRPRRRQARPADGVAARLVVELHDVEAAVVVDEVHDVL